ncbi:MAG: hypothetical protein JWL84_1451 [Rhodospirillales bacterium]|nr:hypothetical protein [Rhodospirillales bacterium]
MGTQVVKERCRAPAEAGRCVALAEEWMRISSATGMTADQAAAAGDRQGEIEDDLETTPAVTGADVIAKARVIAELERHGITPWEDGPQLAASLLADLERLVGDAA